MVARVFLLFFKQKVPKDKTHLLRNPDVDCNSSLITSILDLSHTRTTAV